MEVYVRKMLAWVSVTQTGSVADKTFECRVM